MKISDLGNSFRRNRKPEENDLGFGTKIGTSGGRLINRDGSFNVQRVGRHVWTPYQTLVEMSWPRFFSLVVLFYVSVNFIFALLFLGVGLENINGLGAKGGLESFAQAFFLSVQTFTTVGYGLLSPNGVAANMVAAFDALVGLMALALATGLLFARFSKPKAQIIFSENAVFAPYGDGMSFQFRIANLRNNRIINLNARVTMTWLEHENGEEHRRYAMLKLERDQVFLFPLNWTIVHPIEASSPLWGKSIEDIIRMKAEFVILIQGHDETFAQQVHTSNSYICKELVWNARFIPMYFSQNGQTVLELDQINHFQRLDAEGT